MRYVQAGRGDGQAPAQQAYTCDQNNKRQTKQQEQTHYRNQCINTLARSVHHIYIQHQTQQQHLQHSTSWHNPSQINKRATHLSSTVPHNGDTSPKFSVTAVRLERTEPAGRRVFDDVILVDSRLVLVGEEDRRRLASTTSASSGKCSVSWWELKEAGRSKKSTHDHRNIHNSPNSLSTASMQSQHKGHNTTSAPH